MKKLVVRVLCFALLVGFYPSSIYAASENNKFGIHITDIHEAEKAAQLVNSNGGDWGYITLTINSNDREVQKWQDKFNALNEKHLIPIIRIATFPDGDSWRKPSKDDPKDWADFFNKLYWPIQKRHVIIYNEPNHATEWGNSVDPAEVARYLDETMTALRASSPDYVIMNPGFDSSAPQKLPAYMDQVAYMDAMEKAVPGIFGKLDAWSSHSYPNPGFAGKPGDTGRGTIANYKWELELLRSRYRVQKSLPVYITETGWIVRNAEHPSIRVDEQTAATYMEEAYQRVWLPDASVVAVTPFLLTSKQSLFSHFSWLRQDDSETAFYTAIKDMQKIPGKPARENKAIVTTVSIPGQIAQSNEVIANIAFKNTGNTVWTANDSFTLDSSDPTKLIIRDNFALPENIKVTPGQSFNFRFTLYTENILTKAPLSLQMKQNETPFGEKLYIPIRIFQPPKLTVKTDSQTNSISGVTVTFRSLKDIDAVENAIISKTGIIGTYTSKVFVPNQSILVTLQAPNRDQVTEKITVSEGENLVSFKLPPEKSIVDRLFSAFRR